MGALFLVHDRDPAFATQALAGARAQFASHRLTGLNERKASGWTIIHAPYVLGGEQTFLEDGDDFVAVAGTLTFGGTIGEPALRGLLDAVELPAPDWSRLGGQFAAVIHKNGRTLLLTDYFSAFQLFHDTEGRVFSTSMLSAMRALPRLSFDPQGVYEFAFNVVAIGNDTVLSELKLLGPEHVVALSPAGARFLPVAKPLPEAAAAMPEAARIARHRDRLMDVVHAHAARYGDNVYCPLSGGLDSRLVLAALRAQGIRPHIYVYGPADSSDVRIARDIGRSEGFDVEWVDKQANNAGFDPDDFVDQVERNFQEYDALPNFGELFENGSNGRARDARHRNGALSVSGGCGEIFRNFFFLPNRRLPARSVAKAFFGRFVEADVTPAFDRTRFFDAIETKILQAIGREGDHGPLPRAVIEQVYPRIRCRSLFGKEISVEGRHGGYLMPFLDHELVADATRLPLHLKNAGRFEAMLLNAIDPVLASHPSAYGHDFAGPPNRAHRWEEFSTRVRPIWLRQMSYGLRRRMGPMADEHGGLLTPDFTGRVIDLDYPAMRAFFDPDRITDSSVLRRVACLEYLAKHLGSKLSQS